MHALNVRRLVARYHLPAGAERDKERFDAIVSRGLENAADVALGRAGVPLDEELCIRKLDVAVRTRLAAPDAASALQWSLALAQAVRGALARGGPNVVRYASRRSALVDLVLSVARGDSSRTWAFRQLDLWREAPMSDAASALSEVARALGDEPTAIVPILSIVAREGALGHYLEQLSLEHWTRLAEAALSAADTRTATTLSDLGRGSSTVPRELPSRLARSAVFAAFGRHLERSGSHADSALWGEPRRLRAIAALVALEVEPALPSRGAHVLSAWIRSIERQLAPASSVHLWSSTTKGFGPDAQADATLRGAATEDLRLSSRAAHGSASERQPPSGQTSPTARAAAAPHHEVEPRAERSSRDETLASERPPREREAAERAPLEVRRRASTAFGGLLLVLNLLEPLEIPVLLANALERRSLRWSLHQLALSLVEIEASDPAALAFSGLGPDAEPPDKGEPVPTAEELELFSELVHRLHDSLRELLKRQPRESLSFLYRRRAVIVADPGWIAVHFDLDDVSTDLRRVGLDLDPGFIPWLGVIVKFRYV